MSYNHLTNYIENHPGSSLVYGSLERECVMIFLDSKASNLNVQEFKDRWEAKKVCMIVPFEAPVMFRTLIGAALQSESLEDAKAILTKATEVMDWVWPLGRQTLTSITHEDLQIRVPLK